VKVSTIPVTPVFMVYVVLVNPNIFTENGTEYVVWNLNPSREKPPVLLDTLHFIQLRMRETIRGEGVEFSRGGGLVQERKSQQHNWPSPLPPTWTIVSTAGDISTLRFVLNNDSTTKWGSNLIQQRMPIEVRVRTDHGLVHVMDARMETRCIWKTMCTLSFV